MKKIWLLLGLSALVAVLALGAIACDDDNDDGDEPPAATEPVDEEPQATEPIDEEPAATEDPSTGGEVDDVIVAEHPELGSILTTSDGYTLYITDNDSAGESTCTDACVDIWPVFPATGELTGGEGATGTLSTIEHPSGATQVTYNDMPLYLYANDAAPGDATGEGVAGVWHVATP